MPKQKRPVEQVERGRAKFSHSRKCFGTVITDSISSQDEREEFPILSEHISQSMGQAIGVDVGYFTETKRQMDQSSAMNK